MICQSGDYCEWSPGHCQTMADGSDRSVLIKPVGYAGDPYTDIVKRIGKGKDNNVCTH